MDNNTVVAKQFKNESIFLVQAIIDEVGKTPEFRRIRNALISDMLASWANGSIIKKKMAKYINASFVWDTKSANFEPETKIESLKLWGNLGKLITSYARLLTVKDDLDADRIANKIEKPLKDLLENTDFGYLYEMVANSDERVAATHKKLNEVLSDYPSKLGILPAIKIRQINTGLKKKSLALAGATRNMTPETLVSTVTSLVGNLISAENIAELANEASLLLHKMGAGNEIMSEAGKTAFEALFIKKLEDVLPLLNTKMTCKAIKDVMDITATVQNAFIHTLKENPEFLSGLIAAYPDIKNTKIRSAGRKASMMEEFAQSEEGSGKIADAIAEVDFQDMGDAINAWLRTFNAVRETRSEFLTRSAASLLSMIDLDNLEEAAQWLIPGLLDAVKPASHIIMPSLVNGLAQMLAPAPGMDNAELTSAVKNFKAVLNAIGGDDI